MDLRGFRPPKPPKVFSNLETKRLKPHELLPMFLESPKDMEHIPKRHGLNAS